jgi:hypothetical protein
MRSIISRGLSRGHALVHRGEIPRIFHRDLTFCFSLPPENKDIETLFIKKRDKLIALKNSNNLVSLQKFRQNA